MNEDFFRTKKKDIAFHRSRRMFVLMDENFKISPKNTKMSHLEWFEKEGWVNDGNKKEFLEKNIRGLYSPKTNQLFFFKGYFEFDDELILKVKNNVYKLKKLLNLNENTEINFGPVDEVIDGKEYKKICLGELKDIHF